MLNFHFLETEFLEKYLGRWKQDVEGTVSLTQDKKSRMQLSKQNLYGWNLTGSNYSCFILPFSDNFYMILEAFDWVDWLQSIREYVSNF